MACALGAAGAAAAARARQSVKLIRHEIITWKATRPSGACAAAAGGEPEVQGEADGCLPRYSFSTTLEIKVVVLKRCFFKHSRHLK